MPYKTRSVTSADGTELCYREWGAGPGLVLIHGGLQAAQNFSRLAEALGDTFTVYVPDRRGRGRSGAFGEGYGLSTEREDLHALLRATGARRVFGLSSGALIALYAARTLSEIEQLAIYEPPLTVPGANPMAWVPRYEKELERGRLAEAMASIIKGTGDVEPITYLPRFILAMMIRLGIAAEARSVKGEDVAIRDLIPTMRFDAKLARESVNALEGLDTLRCEVLLLGGNRSARLLRVGLDALAARLPRAKRVQLKRIGHLAADNVGRPDEVARLLRTFFRQDAAGALPLD